ncbi:MAG: hypothetical protein EVA89_35140 [Sandaracinaceae bacterium]|nr:MAG: hypothetical protein EVA89_35140 [Sandaracinaceae bacterium]
MSASIAAAGGVGGALRPRCAPLPSWLRESPALAGALRLLDQVPSELAMCPQGLEVVVAEEPRVGLTVGFPLNASPLECYPPLSTLESWVASINTTGPVARRVSALLERARAHQDGRDGRLRNVYLAFEPSDGALALAGPVLGFREDDAWPAAERWRLLLGDDHDAFQPQLEAWSAAHADQPPPVYLGAAVRGGARVLKSYTRGAIGDQIRRLAAFAGANPLPPRLVEHLLSADGLTAMRPEDWRDGEMRRMGLELSLRFEGGTRSIRPGVEGTPLTRWLDAELLDLMDAGGRDLQLDDGSVQTFGINHLKVSVTADGGVEWKMYLIHFVLPSSEARARRAVDALFG